MIHSTAVISDQANVADDVEIGPYTVIGDHVEIDSGTRIDSHVVINGPTKIGKDNHIYQTCFVCGTERTVDDGLCLYPGPVDDWSLLACTWRPNASLLNDTGDIREEYIWSALDCPGYFAAAGENLRITLLGELKGKLLKSVPGNQELIVFSWPIGESGRKLYGGVAIANGQGEVLAYSHTTWIELK